MALFQEEATNKLQADNQAEDKKYNDSFSRLGFDDVLNYRKQEAEKQAEKEKIWVQNIVSPEKINEWQNKGTMSAIDVWEKKDKHELIPYASTIEAGTKSFKLKDVSDRLNKGLYVSPEERKQFEDFVLDMAEVQTRGLTVGGKFANIGLETIPFMLEFGAGLLTSGGTSSLGATASKLSTVALKKSLLSQIGQGVAKTAYNATLNPRTYAFTATRLPQQVRARMGDIMLSDSVAVTPEGQAILKEAEEKPATAFFKALALTNIEVASEMSGAMLVRPVLNATGKLGKVITSPIAKMFPEGFAEKFVNLAEKVTNMPFVKAVDNLGLNGVLEEMGEERIGDLLQFAFNLNGEDGYSFEQFLDALFPNISQGFGAFAEEMTAEALAFGVTGMGMNAINAGLKKVSPKYTKDGFLLDAGIFRITGYDSYLDKKVREELTQRGTSEEEIDNALNFSTRDDKVQFLNEAKIEFDTKKEFDEKELIKDIQRQEVEEKTYEKFTQGGKVENEQAFGLSKLFGVFYKKYASGSEKAKEKFNNWFNKFDVRYNVPADSKNVLHQFAGEKAENNDKFKLSEAKKRLKNGEDAETVRKQTGWFKGVDGKFRYEISDKDAKINETLYQRAVEKEKNMAEYDEKHVKVNEDISEARKKINSLNDRLSELYDIVDKKVQGKEVAKASKEIAKLQKEYTKAEEELLKHKQQLQDLKDDINNKVKDLWNIKLSDLLDHEKLYAAYPSIKNVKVDFVDFGNNVLGRYSDIENEISLSNKLSIEEARKTLMHEIQHYIQDIEGFAKGSSTNSVERELRKALEKIIESPENTKFEELIDELEIVNKARLVHSLYKNPENITKTYWYMQKGKGWFAPRKTKKKARKQFINECCDEFLSETLNKYNNESTKTYPREMKIDRYNSYLQKDKSELDKIAKSLDNKSWRMFDKVDNLNKNKIQSALKNYEEKGETQYGLVELYHQVAGEVEARNTEVRRNLSEEEREIFSPYDDDVFGYDVNPNEQLVIFDDGTSLNYRGPKTLFQDANDEDEKLIAGFTYPEVLAKLTDLYDQLGSEKYKPTEEEEKKLWAKVHVLEDAFEIAENPEKFSNEDKRQEVMLNAYYIMNNQEIPEDYIETDSKSKRTYNDYVKLHNEKKEQKEAEYYGYFTEGTNQNVITIMQNSNASTALHELGHLFYNGLVELSNASDEAKAQLEAVNKQFGIIGEPTVKQLERFARSFEAYLYKGKAPNSTLRKVFENFKEWLKAVYHDIATLQNKGADISDEVQELFDRMFGDDEFYQEQREANELLRKVKEVSANELKKIRKDKEKEIDESKITLTPEQKKYKDTAYDVLWYALSNSKIDHKPVLKDKRQLYMLLGNNHTVNKRNKGVMKQGEKLEQFLAELDDPFSAGDGFLPEWKDYFKDTITEDSDDSALAMQAYNVIVNHSYLKQDDMLNELDKRAEFFEKAVNDADREYKILIREYKNGNRNVALSAIYEWLEKMPSEIKQDYEDKFIYDSGIIDREENVDKFDKAKRQILVKALELDNQFGINNDEKYQETVKQIMRSLDFLQPEDKAKLTANILDVPSTSFLMSSIDNIMDIAKTMEDINLRRTLEREIHKELQGTKNVKKNGRSVGKYDYKTNKLFEELRDLDRLSPEQANELRLELGKFASAEDNGLSFKDKLVNKFLSYKAGGRTFADTELMKDLYDSILKIKLAGKSAKSELDLMEKLDETKDIEELINIVQGKKEANFMMKGYINLVANLESALNALFNKDIKEKYGSEILYAETQAQAWQHQQKQKFEKQVAKIYGLPEWAWDKKILDYLAEKHKYTEIRRKYDEKGELIKTRNVERTLTKMDIIQAYIWSKNEVLEKRLMNQFGEDTLNAMFDELSLEDVKLAEAMMNLAQSFYPLVNKAFINKYGLDLPKVSCYFPSTPERGSEVDLYNDYSSKSMNNSFTKARAQSETQAMDFHNPVATLYNHIDGVSKFVFMSESLDKANLRFKDLDLKRVIINKFGEDAYRTLEQALMNITYKKEAPVFNGMNKIIDNMVGNWIQANIAVKPIVGLKQLLSANNYAVDMPYMTWQAGFLKALSHPKETIDYMMNIPYIKARFEGNFSNEFLKSQIENSAFATSKKLKDACTMFVKIGDIGAIIFGGKPYIDYLIKDKGITEEQAIKQFILSTNRSQQSSAISSLSNFQVNMTRNPMGKLFIAFKNSPQQYVRMCGDAIVSVTNGDMSKPQCAKMLFQYGYLQPFFYAVATSGSLLRYLFTGDDDDLIRDAKMSVFNLGSDALPLVGDIYKYTINTINGDKMLPQTTPLLGDMQGEILKMSKNDVTLADYLEGIGYLGLHVGLGYNSKAFANIGSGIGDIATGEVGQGAMKVLGYTERRSKHITGTENTKKKK